MMQMNDNVVCNACQHFLYGGTDLILKCEAFPEGIPDRICEEGDNHNEVLPGQTGDYVFLPKFQPKSESQKARLLTKEVNVSKAKTKQE
jgi:hypothetical protein